MSMKSESEIYQAARNVDGKSHSIVIYYNPQAVYVSSFWIQIQFPGYAWKENREAFIREYLNGYIYSRNDEAQTVIVY